MEVMTENTNRRTALSQKNPQKIKSKKFVKLLNHTKTCNNLTQKKAVVLPSKVRMVVITEHCHRRTALSGGSRQTESKLPCSACAARLRVHAVA